MYSKFMLTIIAICMCMLVHYAKKSCTLEPMIADSEIHIEQKVDRMGLTLNFLAQLFNVIPETKVNGKYLPAQNQGFVARIINQIRRDYPWYSASDEVIKAGIWQCQYTMICWANWKRQREAKAEIDQFADNAEI
ncbi:MAG: hypothetical protein A2Y60_03600 [Chloroflexi bacterium RBG_13_54_9]|nr:MAG: hypothetical protein A2Y60_03600 [Chloroflexi bacterium RBG_13_54_9]